MDHKTIYTTTKPRSIQDDMTEQEMNLFHSDLEHWGNAQDCAQRGAIYLDRVMPDWYTRVELTTLQLSSTCKCVLGQIFSTEAADLLSRYEKARYAHPGINNRVDVMAGDTNVGANSIDSGFHLGHRLLGLELVSEGAHNDDGDVNYGASSFFGFDYTINHSFNDLTEAWTEQIETRVRSAL